MAKSLSALAIVTLAAAVLPAAAQDDGEDKTPPDVHYTPSDEIVRRFWEGEHNEAMERALRTSTTAVSAAAAAAATAPTPTSAASDPPHEHVEVNVPAADPSLVAPLNLGAPPGASVLGSLVAPVPQADLFAPVALAPTSVSVTAPGLIDGDVRGQAASSTRAASASGDPSSHHDLSDSDRLGFGPANSVSSLSAVPGAIMPTTTFGVMVANLGTQARPLITVEGPAASGAFSPSLIGASPSSRIVQSGASSSDRSIPSVAPSAVPSPIVGTGLPGLASAVGLLWALARRRRRIKDARV